MANDKIALDTGSMTFAEKQRLLALLKEKENRNLTGGHLVKIYPDEGPLSWKNYPKHMRFFEAGKKHKERFASYANRCFSAKSMVWMANGDEKPIEDVCIGDKVLAYDKTKHSLVPSTVVDTYKGYADNVHYYQPRNALRGISCTDDHEFLIRSQRGKYHLRRIKDFRYWDRALIASKWTPRTKTPNFSIDAARLLGLLVGDGYLCAKQGATKFTNNELEIIEFAETVAKNEFESSPRIVPGTGDWWDIYFPKKEKSRLQSKVNRWLEDLGLLGTRSGERFVPDQILYAPTDYVKAFIQGLLAADGSYNVGRITLHTTSERLAKGFNLLCLRLNVTCSPMYRKMENENHADRHDICVCGNRYLETIGDSFHKKVQLNPRGRKKFRSTKGLTMHDMGKEPPQDVYCITVDHPDHLFCVNGYIVSNCGKTLGLGAYESACHLTGMYPDWWPGHKFDHPIEMWAAGDTSQTTRDIVQKELIGQPGEEGTGMIAADLLANIRRKAGVPDGVESFKVKHVSGGWSYCGLKSFDQGRRSFQGTAKHFIWLDELMGQDVYGECLVRTMTTKGLIIVTATPVQGLTPFVQDFIKTAVKDVDVPSGAIDADINYDE